MQGGSHVRPKRSLLGCAWCTSSNLNNSGDTSFDESQRAGMFLDDKVELAHRGIDGCCHSSPSAPPSKDQSGDRVDKLLAADLNSLSLQERDVVYEEIHGVASPVKETPLLVQTSLDELHREISRIKHKPAYDQAMATDPYYIQNPTFCIKFLRSKLFDAKAAAAQLVAHLEIKHNLFGSHRLCRNIDFSDLDENDRGLLRTGAYPFLKTRDRAGRAICFFIYRLTIFQSIENWARMFFFFCMSHAEDEDVQRRGLTVIIWMHGSRTSLTQNDFLLWSRGAAVADTLPLRISGGMHYCAARNATHPALELTFAFTGQHLRIRFRIHVGSPLECLYNLGSYGIPLCALPVDSEGEVILDEHLAWYHQLSVAAQTPHLKTGLRIYKGVIPGPSDILLGGRSKEFMYNPGNLTLRRMVEEALPKYNALLSRGDKTSVTLEIVQRIKSDGARFLYRKVDFTWKEVNDEMAREKVAHTFRNLRRFVKKKTTKYSKAQLQLQLVDSQSDDMG